MTYDYNRILTTRKGVKFYVKTRKFMQEYLLNSYERLRVKERIEHEYISILSHNCRLEKHVLRWGYQLEAYYCDMLTQFKAL